MKVKQVWDYQPDATINVSKVSFTHGLFPFSPNSSPLRFSMLSWCVRLGWDAVSVSLVLSFSRLRSCLPASLPSAVSPRWSCLSLVSRLVSQLVSHLHPQLVLGCCVRLSGLVFLLSPNLSHLVWGCCVLRLRGLVLVFCHLVWDAVSASLGFPFSSLRSCLPPCFPAGRGCCVRLLGLGLSRVFSPSLSPMLSPTWCPPSYLVSQPSLSPILSCSWSGMPFRCLGLVSKSSCAICASAIVWGLPARYLMQCCSLFISHVFHWLS